MKTPLIASIGMPRAGSGWHYNLIHDLVVASGGKDSRRVRKQFMLGVILTEINCNIGAFTPQRLLPVMVPSLLGQKYVIKAHAGPTPLVLRLIGIGRVIPIYIYRDPRDALLSAYEYGKRKREDGRSGAFAELVTIEDAIAFMEEYVTISEAWLDCDQALHCRYEDLLTDYPGEAARLAKFLGIDVNTDGYRGIIEMYQPIMGSRDQRGTHFRKGVIGRYRDKMTREQLALCNNAFGNYLERMRYPLE